MEKIAQLNSSQLHEMPSQDSINDSILREALDFFCWQLNYVTENRKDLREHFKQTNPRIETLTMQNGSTYKVPVIDVVTKDRGNIPTLAFDVSYPKLRNELLNNALHITGCNIIQDGLPERIIDVLDADYSSEKNVFKSLNLTRYSRYLKNGWTLKPTIDKDLIRYFIQENLRRWRGRTGQPYFDDFIEQEIDYSRLLDHVFAVFTDSNGLSALVEIVKEGSTLHWVNTYRGDSGEANTARLGNNVLLSLILITPVLGCTELNMGIDTFDYKKTWSNTVRFAKGLSY